MYITKMMKMMTTAWFDFNKFFFIKTKQKHSHIDLFLPSILFGAHVVLFEL